MNNAVSSSSGGGIVPAEESRRPFMELQLLDDIKKSSGGAGQGASGPIPYGMNFRNAVIKAIPSFMDQHEIYVKNAVGLRATIVGEVVRIEITGDAFKRMVERWRESRRGLLAPGQVENKGHPVNGLENCVPPAITGSEQC